MAAMWSAVVKRMADAHGYRDARCPDKQEVTGAEQRRTYGVTVMLTVASGPSWLPSYATNVKLSGPV